MKTNLHIEVINKTGKPIAARIIHKDTGEIIHNHSCEFWVNEIYNNEKRFDLDHAVLELYEFAYDNKTGDILERQILSHDLYSNAVMNNNKFNIFAITTNNELYYGEDYGECISYYLNDRIDGLVKEINELKEKIK